MELVHAKAWQVRQFVSHNLDHESTCCSKSFLFVNCEYKQLSLLVQVAVLGLLLVSIQKVSTLMRETRPYLTIRYQFFIPFALTPYKNPTQHLWEIIVGKYTMIQIVSMASNILFLSNDLTAICSFLKQWK